MWNQGHTFHSPCLIWCVNPASASYSVAENCISVPLWKSESDWRHFHAVRTPQAARLEGSTHCSSWDNNQLAAFRCHDKKQFLSQAGSFFYCYEENEHCAHVFLILEEQLQSTLLLLLICQLWLNQHPMIKQAMARLLLHALKFWKKKGTLDIRS